MRKLFLTMLAIASPLSAQVTYSGNGCGDRQLHVVGTPSIGKTVGFEFSTLGGVRCDGTGCNWLFLVLGGSLVAYRGVPLPVTVQGCLWTVSPEIILAVGSVGGWAPYPPALKRVDLPIPYQVALVGLAFHGQFWTLYKDRYVTVPGGGTRTATVRIQP